VLGFVAEGWKVAAVLAVGSFSPGRRHGKLLCVRCALADCRKRPLYSFVFLREQHPIISDVPFFSPMNGRIFDPRKSRKNAEKGCFEETM
jgi:hypothetical protein